jgi:hypothetical protein
MEAFCDRTLPVEDLQGAAASAVIDSVEIAY